MRQSTSRNNMNNKTKKTFPALGRVTAIAAAAGLALTACGDGEAADTGGDGGDTIEMGIFQGWEEGIAVSELWANILEDEGYTVNKTYVDLAPGDRKSTRLNSSHVAISYAVFCLKKKKTAHER